VTKLEAAKFLGVSTRAIERYTAKGKLQCTYRRVKSGGQRAMYNSADVKKLKKEIEQEHKTIHQQRQQALEIAQASSAVSRRNAAPKQSAMPGGAIAERLIAVLESLKPSDRPALMLADKLTLNLAEAASLSGLSKSWLLDAIHSGKLKAAKRGRSWNIKRADLDTYIKRL